jgi:ElaB/YqjD/DUF883 family membrane-anchored ribosome-binding protein
MAGPTSYGPSFSEQPRTDRPEESGMLGSAASAVKEKAKDLASSASDMASQVKDTAKDWASSAASGAQHAWESTRDEARHLAGQVAHTAENAWDGLGDFIRRNPVPSLLIALGVGFLLGSGLGAMTSRRSDW